MSSSGPTNDDEAAAAAATATVAATVAVAVAVAETEADVLVETASTTSTSSSIAESNKAKGVAGRTNYAQWDKVANTLLKETEAELKEEEETEKKKLGLDGKYARSQAEHEERLKAKDVKKVKKTLQKYKKREEQAVMNLAGLQFETHEDKTVRITRDMLDAGTRVTRIQDTAGTGITSCTLVLTQDLSLLESRMKVNAMAKSYKDDVENYVPVEPGEGKRQEEEQEKGEGKRQEEEQEKGKAKGQEEEQEKAKAKGQEEVQENGEAKGQDEEKENGEAKGHEEEKENGEAKGQDEEKERSVFGLIKAFFQNVSHCTILIKCKLISGMIDLHHCHDLLIKVIGPEATVATVQVDLSQNIQIEFHDAPSGKNTPLPHQKEPQIYWGDDKDDRIFHAGVSNLAVKVYRDGIVDMETTADYIRDGAVPVGNATAEEMQFVTSVVNGILTTESVVRTGQSTGQQVRAMTQREVEAEKERRAKAANMAQNRAEEMVRVKDKEGNPVVTKTQAIDAAPETDVIEEVLSPQVQAIVDECMHNKKRGNEAFGTGEYGQAILLYSLALDKADELGDIDGPCDDNHDNKNKKQHLLSLFPRDVVYSNRAACFLKLGQHEKAEADAAAAIRCNPNNIKAIFRRGLALHAMQQYETALPLLAKAHKMEPKNAQIKQALQFCEVRLEQEHRKRMAGDGK